MNKEDYSKFINQCEINEKIDMSQIPPNPGRCELCFRQTKLTQHHLIPKRLHRNQRIIARYGRTTLRTRIAWLCLACHKHVHRCLSERELGVDYATVDLLRAHPDIQSFAQWLQRKPDDFKPRLSRRKKTP